MSIEAMKQALEFVASISPAFICEATHHTKKERHDAFKPCPHVERHNRVFESLRQAIEQAEKKEPVVSAAYDKIDRFLRNNLDDIDYEEYVRALDRIYTTPPTAPVQEPVVWRYRSVSPFVGKDGTYKVSDGWTLIHKPEQRDAHSAMCGMEAEPLYTTPPAAPVQDVDWQKKWADEFAKRGAEVAALERKIAELTAAPVQEPYGQVTVVKRPGCVDQHWFYRWPEPPYLDNAAECHVVYTTPQPQQEKQEPVAWVDRTCLKNLSDDFEPTIGKRPVSEYDVPLYTTPQLQREWVGLTDKEIDQGLCRTPYVLKTSEAWREGVRWAYHQLKEKNT